LFKHVVSREHELREIMGEPNLRSLDKKTTYLTATCIQFISKAPFLLLATSGKNDRCDVAPKGDPAGFVRVLDDKHMMIP
jgi:predicted pyridoxine 5'-phosphate oxidase superfamily flavin-nucleotide-binding protein